MICHSQHLVGIVSRFKIPRAHLSPQILDGAQSLLLLDSKATFKSSDGIEAVLVKQLKVVECRALPSLLCRRLRLGLCASAPCIHRIAEVLIDIVVSLALPLWQVDKVASVLLVRITIVLTVKRERVHASFVLGQETKIREVMLGISLQLGLHCVGPFFTLCNQRIDIFISVCTPFPTQDLIRTKADHSHKLVLFQRRMLLCQSALLDDGSVKE
mmetsp:Transcript_17228/g.39957  ORF Transcript_17228/g.39957 Transcript_17228/m.39957 type:complete len:214 (+) Transcript_17228:3154-3795(+)